MDFQQEKTSESDTPRLDYRLTQELSSHAIRETLAIAIRSSCANAPHLLVLASTIQER